MIRALALLFAVLACAEPQTQTADQGEACIDAREQQRRQLALTLELVQLERQLHTIREALLAAKDETFFATLERQQAVLRVTHGELVVELDALVRASAGEAPLLPEGCLSVAACFALDH